MLAAAAAIGRTEHHDAQHVRVVRPRNDSNEVVEGKLTGRLNIEQGRTWVIETHPRVVADQEAPMQCLVDQDGVDGEVAVFDPSVREDPWVPHHGDDDHRCENDDCQPSHEVEPPRPEVGDRWTERCHGRVA